MLLPTSHLHSVFTLHVSGLFSCLVLSFIAYLIPLIPLILPSRTFAEARGSDEVIEVTGIDYVNLVFPSCDPNGFCHRRSMQSFTANNINVFSLVPLIILTIPVDRLVHGVTHHLVEFYRATLPVNYLFITGLLLVGCLLIPVHYRSAVRTLTSSCFRIPSSVFSEARRSWILKSEGSHYSRSQSHSQSPSPLRANSTYPPFRSRDFPKCISSSLGR